MNPISSIFVRSFVVGAITALVCRPREQSATRYTPAVLNTPIARELAGSLLALLLVSCDAGQLTTPGDEPAEFNSVVFLVRHAEKAKGPDPHDPALTPEGSTRAECLARLLASAGVTHVFHSGLVRTRDTVAPLSQRVGVTPVKILAKDTEAQVDALRQLPRGAVAVVAGHSNTIPAMVEALGSEVHGLDARSHIPETTYDRLFQLVLDDRGEALHMIELRFCAPSGS